VPASNFDSVEASVALSSILDDKLGSDGLYTTTLQLSKRINPNVSGEGVRRNELGHSVDLPPTVLFVSRQNRTASDWHDALNHCSAQRLALASSMVDGMALTTNVSKCTCVACQMGKAKNLAYPEKSSRILTREGQVISTDSWGPSTHPDWNGNRYYVSFLCHFTGKSWVFLYANKAALKTITIQFLMLIFNQTGRHCSYLRFDKEGGFTSNLVSEFCHTHGIIQEPSITGAHQQLGRNENFNHHALQGVRTLLTRSGLSLKFWGEALMCWNTVRNVLPAAGYPCTPDEAWFGKRPDVSHLIPFGMAVVAYVMPEHQTSKLFPRGSPGKFLGYASESKGYRILDEATDTVFEARSIQLASCHEWPLPVSSRFGELELPESPAASHPATAQLNNAPSLVSSSTVATPALVSSPPGVTPSPVSLSHPATGTDPQLNNAPSLVSSPSVATPAPVSSPPVVTPSPVSLSVAPMVRPASDFTNVTISSAHIIGDLNGPRVKRHKAKFIGWEKGQRGHHILNVRYLPSVCTSPPSSFLSISGRSDADEWYTADAKERAGLQDNNFGRYVKRDSLPRGTKVIGARRVFTRKLSGIAKVRLVAKDFRRKGQERVYSPVVDEASMKVFFSIAAHEGLDIHVCDVNQAFLHSELDELTYIEIPIGWEDAAFRQTHVILLGKSLYGLRRAPFLWNREINSYLVSQGFTQNAADACVYMKVEKNGGKTILLLHVDDFAIAASDSSLIRAFIDGLDIKYGVKDLGPIDRYLSYQVLRDLDTQAIILHQQEFIASLLIAAGAEHCYASKSKGDLFRSDLHSHAGSGVLPEHSSFPYREIVGGLQHLACHSRPDIAYEAATLARYNQSYASVHIRAALQLLQYLKYTSHYGLHCGGKELVLVGYADGGTVTDSSGRGVGGYVFKLGASTVSFKTKWFTSVHPSTTELEYATLFLASSKAIWLRKLLSGFGYHQSLATVIHEDNEGAIKYAHSLELGGRMGHINVKFHFTREKIASRELELSKIAGTSNVSDIMTKSLRGSALAKFRTELGVRSYADVVRADSMSE
jgi:hypothetical protein